MSMVNTLLKPEEFAYACRCCLYVKNDVTPMYQALIPVMFEKTLNLQLDNSVFPVHICKQCLMQLNRTYTFITQCHRAEEVLNNIVGSDQIQGETDSNLNESEYIVPDVLIEDKDGSSSSDNEEKNEEDEKKVIINVSDNENKINEEIDEKKIVVQNEITEEIQVDGKKNVIKNENIEKIGLNDENINEKKEETVEPPYIIVFKPEVKDKRNKAVQTESEPKIEEGCINLRTYMPITYSTIHRSQQVTVSEVLICYMCSELYQNLSEIRAHVKNHKDLRPSLSVFNCQFCKKLYTSRAAKIDHEKNCEVLIKPDELTPKKILEVRKNEQTFKRITRSSKKIKLKN